MRHKWRTLLFLQDIRFLQLGNHRTASELAALEPAVFGLAASELAASELAAGLQCFRRSSSCMGLSYCTVAAVLSSAVLRGLPLAAAAALRTRRASRRGSRVPHHAGGYSERFVVLEQDLSS